MKVSLRIFFLFIVISTNGFSQKTYWQIGLVSFFDNSEFGNSNFQIPHTMAGVRFAPVIGLKWDSVHSGNIGVDLLHEYGSSKIIDNFFPTAYYQYNKKSYRFLMGAFPRKYAVDRYPRIFFQDSVSYYRPNVNGILLEYTHKKLLANFWLDWTSRQSPDNHETFFLGFSGKYNSGIFYMQQFTYLFHFAGMMNPIVDEALHDNGMIMTSIGLNFAKNTFLDRLEINSGWVVGLDRARSDMTGWKVHHGLLSEAKIEYKWIGLFNTFYCGNGQMYYYKDHNNELYWGDPFYRAKIYNRSDFYIKFIENKVVNINLVYSLHFAENTMYHEQLLKVSFCLNNFGVTH